MNESLNKHLQAFQAIEEIPEGDFSTRTNAFVDAKTAFHTFLEEEMPEHAEAFEDLKAEGSAEVSDEMIDEYIDGITTILEELE
jgi:hypothetical protein